MKTVGARRRCALGATALAPTTSSSTRTTGWSSVHLRAGALAIVWLVGSRAQNPASPVTPSAGPPGSNPGRVLIAY